MKIAGRGGHSEDIRGAVGIVDEVTEDRKIISKVLYYLSQHGQQVLDVTPGYSGTSFNDLSIPISKAYQWGADYFFSLHLNASNGAGHGCETLYKTEAERIIAERISAKLTVLGFSNRGAKIDERGLYEFNNTPNMLNNIIEPFFVDNENDVELYKNIGTENLAKAIVEGILGISISVKYSGWYLIDGYWYYYDKSNNLVKNSWIMDGKDWCYLNENGQALVNGWAKDSTGKWCYCGADCRIVRDKTITWNGKNYYFGKDGYWDNR